MAELNYSDVQRAVSEGLRNLQNSVQRLTSNVSTATRADRIDNIDFIVRDLQRTLQLMQNNLTVMRQVNSADPRLNQIAHDIYELKVRFAAIERFAAQMSEYIQARADQEAEDRQFKAAK